ncbi:hypothetical protein GJQ55_01925 [Venatoribacter cucullus]|uniref:Uncharacterized protein n=1 Tax=Venatoribacter cucullus TaxID=2661630 RepID=A0A9X7YMT5_9GAMM|nr:hypothetical protein [Venatoribacter cucullus]QQD23308.1 hypothetical protein GJQ55_01925 [Venatoribacter cucullus]
MSKQAAAFIVVIFTAQAVHSLQLIPGRPFYYCCGRVGNTGWYLFLLFSHWAVNVFYFYCSSLPCVCNKADAVPVFIKPLKSTGCVFIGRVVTGS